MASNTGAIDLSSFESHFQKNANLSLPEFKAKFPTSRHIESVSYDATKAKFYDQFMNASLRPDFNNKMQNFHLKPDELELLKRNGFVAISPTEKGFNFANEYTTIFMNDLPVFITSDSVLHALHQNYEFLLKALEEGYLSTTLTNILDGMLLNLKQVYDMLDSNGPLRECCKDADLFLTTASSFFMQRTPAFQETTVKVKDMMTNCQSLIRKDILLFGSKRTIDFSRFKPVGRYTDSPFLQKYYRATMWCSLIDIEVAGEQPNPRELGTALVLYLALTHQSDKALFNFKITPATQGQSDTNTKSGPADLETQWVHFNTLLESFVGATNSMNFSQLGNLLHSVCKFKNINEINSTEALTQLHEAIIQEKDLGTKKYNSKGNRVFTLMGQRFTLDNWATSKVTDMFRRRTSGVDVAFSVLGNNDAAEIIHERISNPKIALRDGEKYQGRISSVRETVDAIQPETWNSSVYMCWLDVLRALSQPLDDNVPQSMKTKAYSMKNLNTQLGSWAQLRYDNILFVDEDDMDCICEFPDAYVEPVPKFWAALENLTATIASKLAATTFPSNLAWSHKEGLVKKYTTFSQHVGKLKDISIAQLQDIQLSHEQQKFLKSTVRENSGGGCVFEDGGIDGWYFELFSDPLSAVMMGDELVTSVYSAAPNEAENDPGTILHAGVGKHQLMLICVERGKDVVLFAGPIYSYKEKDFPINTRMTDYDWANIERTIPPPEWAQCYQANGIQDTSASEITRLFEKYQEYERNKLEVPAFANLSIVTAKEPVVDEPDDAMGVSLFD